MSDLPKPSVFYGIGVGPGDPELLTIKAYKLLKNTSVISYLVNRKGVSLAKSIIEPFLQKGLTHIPIHIDMNINRSVIESSYSMGAIEISRSLRQGKDVVFLCEGDPLFYGSYAYLLEKLKDSYECKVIPGITSVQAASSKLLSPLGLLDENVAILSARSENKAILSALSKFDNLAILKVGPHRKRILQLINQSGRTSDCTYCEKLYQDGEQIIDDPSELTDERGPYFSIIFVQKRLKRAQAGEQ